MPTRKNRTGSAGNAQRQPSGTQGNNLSRGQPFDGRENKGAGTDLSVKSRDVGRDAQIVKWRNA